MAECATRSVDEARLGSLDALELSAAQFARVGRLMYQVCGIALPPGKEALVQARLAKRVRALGLSGFAGYLDYVAHDRSGRELAGMVDALTTHKTSFFREPPHFDYLQREIVPALRARRRGVRMWSAGCASGEEAYSLAMVLREALPAANAAAGREGQEAREARDVRILATDVSTRMVAAVRAAVYDEEAVRGVPPRWFRCYFTPVQQEPSGGGRAVRLYRINDAIRRLVHPARLNLIGPWPMRGPFDAIFCRNVMIYFDRPIRQALVERFWRLLRPGGHLFVGLSEGLAAVPHAFRYVAPAIYARDE